jgi:hypothetical protein
MCQVFVKVSSSGCSRWTLKTWRRCCGSSPRCSADVRGVRLGFLLTALCAALAAAPAAAQAHFDLPPALRAQPLPAELRPNVATTPSVEFTARSGRPVWLLPAVGMVAGAILYPMLVDGGCDDNDCMLYIPEPVTGGLVGLLGGITLEVILMIAEGGVDAAPALDLRSQPIHEPSAAQPGEMPAAAR